MRRLASAVGDEQNSDRRRSRSVRAGPLAAQSRDQRSGCANPALVRPTVTVLTLRRSCLMPERTTPTGWTRTAEREVTEAMVADGFGDSGPSQGDAPNGKRVDIVNLVVCSRCPIRRGSRWRVKLKTREFSAAEIHTLGEERTCALRSASFRDPRLSEPPQTDLYVRWCGRGVAGECLLPPLSRFDATTRRSSLEPGGQGTLSVTLYALSAALTVRARASTALASVIAFMSAVRAPAA